MRFAGIGTSPTAAEVYRRSDRTRSVRRAGRRPHTLVRTHHRRLQEIAISTLVADRSGDTGTAGTSGASSVRRRAALAAWGRRHFRWWFPLAFYLLTRVITVLVVLVQQRHQIALPASNGIMRVMFPSAEAPGYFVSMSGWDGQWYQEIATNGYPAILPRDYTGAIDMSPWAFYPVFPLTVGLIMRLTGLAFAPVATTVALVGGAVAMLMLYRFVEASVNRWYAIVAVVGVCTFVSAPVMQASYTESFGLIAIIATLMALRARRWWWLAVALVALALSRNIVLVMVPVVATHGIVRWWNRALEPFPRREQIRVGAFTVGAAALTGLWPAICALGTHRLTAYADTLAAWHIGAGKVQLIDWLDYVGRAYYGVAGQVVAVAAVAAFLYWMISRRSWVLGAELWAWAGAYPAYQLLVTGTHSSRLRYALMGFGFTAVVAWILDQPGLRRWRWVLLAVFAIVGLCSGAWWVSNFMITTHLDGNVEFP